MGEGAWPACFPEAPPTIPLQAPPRTATQSRLPCRDSLPTPAPQALSPVAAHEHASNLLPAEEPRTDPPPSPPRAQVRPAGLALTERRFPPFAQTTLVTFWNPSWTGDRWPMDTLQLLPQLPAHVVSRLLMSASLARAAPPVHGPGGPATRAPNGQHGGILGSWYRRHSV